MGDIFWFKRFTGHSAGFKSLDYALDLPMPSGLDEIIYTDFDELKRARQLMENAIIGFSLEATDADYETVLDYKNSRRHNFQKSFSFLVYHIFNHQTHHRGQITTMLSQLGIDIGDTDLLELIADE